MSMPRPKSTQPHEPRADEHHGRRCFVTQWRSSGPPVRRHSKRFYVASITAALREFRAWLQLWKADPRVRDPMRPQGMTVAQLAAAHVEWARKTFVKRGKPTTHAGKISRATDLFCELYGPRLASEVTAPDLAAWRDWVIGGTEKKPARNRSTVNALLGCIKTMYKWAAETGMVPAIVAEAMSVVGWLKKNRSRAKESRKIESVAIELVQKTTLQMPKHLASMVWLQWHTGMRPDEVCSMRAIDIDRTGTIWVYRPPEHKLAHHENSTRRVALGPQARKIVAPLLTRMGFLFRPSQAVGVHDAGSRYTVAAYRRAITRACDRAGVARWSPNMLRHAFATRVKQEFGLEASRASLGHTTSDTTETYLDRDDALATTVAAKIG